MSYKLNGKRVFYKINTIAEYNEISEKLKDKGLLGTTIPYTINQGKEKDRCWLSYIGSNQFWLYSEEHIKDNKIVYSFEDWCKECIEDYKPETTTLEPNQVLEWDKSKKFCIIVDDIVDSTRVQNIAFSLGYGWSSKKELKYLQSKSLFLYPDKDLTHIPHTDVCSKRDNPWMYAKDFINKYGMADYSSPAIVTSQIPAPKYKVGDKVQICAKGKCNGFGVKYQSGSYDKVIGVENSKSTIKSLEYDTTKKEHYYRLISGSCIAENALNYQEEAVPYNESVPTTKNKVVYCIDKGAVCISYGRAYTVLEEKGDKYYVLDDGGQKGDFYKTRFSDTPPINTKVEEIVSKLPEKWCVRCPIVQKDLIAFLEKNKCGNFKAYEGYIRYNPNGYSDWTNDVREHTLITYEQWKSVYGKEKSIHDSIQDLKGVYLNHGTAGEFESKGVIDAFYTPSNYISEAFLQDVHKTYPFTPSECFPIKKEKAKPDMSLVKEKALIPINITKKTKKKPNFELI